MLNEQTFEFSQARLKLRENLRFTAREGGRDVSYVVEDELTGQFFRIGRAEYTFLSLLNGQRTVSSALMKSATLLRQDAIDESEAASLCRWAIESGLIDSGPGGSATRVKEFRSRARTQAVLSYANPLMVKIPLFDPDQIARGLAALARPLMNPFGLMVWLAVVIYGFLQLAQQWNVFYARRIESFSPLDLVWIVLTWMLLKTFHEIGHAATCRYFGGRVKSFGILLLLLIPLPYVDVTSAWRLESKWKRILVSAAGMGCEIFLAAIACVVWVRTSPGPLQYHAGNVIISASLHTLLFNVNPLMRFDGYYILSDWLDLPNLATNGRLWLKSLGSYVFLGTARKDPREGGWRGWVVRGYGVLSLMWFTLIACSLTLAASSLLDGFGLVFAIAGLLLWIGLPLWKLCKFLCVGNEITQPNRLRFLSATECAAVLIAAFLNYCPSPSVISAPLVIEYEPSSVVRAESSGFVQELFVSDGQRVYKGQVLAKLSNIELESEWDSITAELEIQQLQGTDQFTDGEIHLYQQSLEAIRALTQRREVLKQRLDALTIRSPQNGVVMRRSLDELLGTYLRPGDELLVLAEPEDVQAKALARQTDLRWIQENPSGEVEITIWGYQDVMSGSIQRVAPRARDDLPHQGLAAAVGGPLPVLPREKVKPDSESDPQSLILTNPRVPVEIAIAPNTPVPLLAGQIGEVAIRSRKQTMGEFLYEKGTLFLKRNNSKTHGL